ncbi:MULTISPECIES: hypoxanthine phosphoribosyltransferase [Thalassospira]|jgi:hypoxanthine phosphoribosyltransferase|uniref:Hypoxanthine phosphoribosyltransferase n=4 Tax=Thalassospira TaxID=168934 RepID=A0A367V382_9PROT|nr:MULTISPECIES: hypoxanthine phosphoribosyltransferase [Thalassospira]KXJ51803.1 MAG: hypoxanthine phosphoribosyltransferase [Thalassospira sp. Nap_22]MBR9899849.1 hypoxanthine phosphoribosyltransferase [Rhodospirillales bacterium]EKF06776.1 hypoxanthine phosphoribosyltransferase [Thalassospira profundimaris WP0211]KJE37068.1 hypoxanthine phosphoribosyltransferase [Thalassospira sp. HJ]KZB72667.1 hypoxanthine phosphoribosyltransferase [Thalassospira sp. MCCC 1A01148]|tara:strand:+ start:3500 stop:4036 length:537 start_codon:yes stop_codon:yes gene_type:complete
MADYDVKPLITADEIATKIDALAAEINESFKDTEKLIVVGLLRGSFVFIADLVRKLTVPVEVDFMVASSYGDSTESSRNVRIVKDLDGQIRGKDVVLVEDIIDTGYTLSEVVRLLKTRDPNRLEICTLLNKPSRREVEIPIDFCGFDIPDEFVVGYGIDYAQNNRNLPFIGTVHFHGE